MTLNCYLFPSALGALTPVSKAQVDNLLVSLDYSGWLNPAEQLSGMSFALTPGTVPPLIISKGGIATNANASPSTSAIPGSPQASQPNSANSLLSFIAAQGQANVQYTLGITVTTNAGRIKTDSLTIQVRSNPGSTENCDDNYGRGTWRDAPPGGYSPNRQAVPTPAVQQATLFNGASTQFASSFVQYTVANSAPAGANVLDLWFNTVDGLIYQYVTDGVSAFWLNMTPAPSRPPLCIAAPPTPAVSQFQIGDIWWDTVGVAIHFLVNKGAGNVWS